MYLMSIYIYICYCDVHMSPALPVTFKQKLRNVIIEEGNTATLRCELSKPGHVVEWWRRGETLLRNGEKYHIRQRDVLIELRVTDVTPEDSDIYTCICGNAETTATLTVNALPITFKQKLKNLQVEEGHNVTLTCEVNKPGVPVEWTLAGEPLENDEKFQMKQRGSVLELMIRDAEPEDSGVYTCTSVPARFKVSLKSQEAEEGTDATLRCELSKRGAVVQWQRDGRPGGKYEMKQEGRLSKLVVYNVEESDAGTYTCKTKDSQSIAELTVQGKDDISGVTEQKRFFCKSVHSCSSDKISKCILQRPMSADVEEVSFKIVQSKQH
uniref:Ig-like domain-containing protein n=1 Tax=Cynoglossus semilaevis TaxID=244447 RepID=A0A3P8W6N1_CYNSE